MNANKYSRLDINWFTEVADFYGVEIGDILDHNGEFKSPKSPIHNMKHSKVNREDFLRIGAEGRASKYYLRKIKQEHNI